MSSTRKGAGASSPRVAPRNESRASSSPLTISGADPASSRTGRSNPSAFEASRTAAVAATRIRSTWSARARRTYRAITSSVRSSASGASLPVSSTP